MSFDPTKLENEYKQVQSDLKQVGDQLKQYAENTEKQIKAQGEVNAETKAAADKALSQFGELQASMREIEQKLTRPQGQGDEKVLQTIGEMVISHEDAQKLNSSYRGAVRVQVPRQAIMNVPASVGDNTSAGNSLVPADRRMGIIAPGLQRLTIRDLLAPGSTSSNNVEYTRETGFTNNAAPVAEGADKPYSDITFELENAPVRTIAHLFKASRQILDDAPALRSYIDARARYGLQLKEEAQLLYGNGSGQNLFGIVPQASPFSQSTAGIAALTGIDRIRLALLQAVLAEFPATGIVLHPIDWAGIELTKDLEGRYIIGNPANGTTPRLWNLPVVETPAMAQDQYLVGAFSLGAQIFDRMAIEVLVSTENDKDFEKNLVSIRCEERLALAVYRPEAFVTGSISGAAASSSAPAPAPSSSGG